MFFHEQLSASACGLYVSANKQQPSALIFSSSASNFHPDFTKKYLVYSFDFTFEI
jgi:hypothetical protein